MTNKIDVSRILRDHLATLKDYSTGRYQLSDFALFFGTPLVVAGLLTYFRGIMSETTSLILATSLSLFAALLFNLLLLVYDNVRKEQKREDGKTLRADFLRQIYSNISFSIFIAILAVILLVVTSWDIGVCEIKHALTFITYYLTTLFVLTLLMILKRVHVLLSKEFE